MESDHAPRQCHSCKDDENLNLKAYVIEDDLFWLCFWCDGLKGWPNQPMEL